MSAQDKSFYDKVTVVIGILIVVAAGGYVLARVIACGSQEVYIEQEPMAVAELEKRIAPVALVAVEGEENPDLASAQEPAAAAVVEAPPVEAALSGPQVYNTACLACHAAGVAGAPVLGDAAAWAPRIALGVDLLTQHAIEGYQGEAGYMPPKGGRTDLSDEEIAAAIQYMVAESQ